MTLRSDDLRAETRWSQWACEAQAHGVMSVLSFQLLSPGDTLGALEVYGDEPNAFDADAENIGL